MRGQSIARRVWCAPFRRDRRELLRLFKLADDSEPQIAGYLHQGEIIFAAQRGRLLGYAQVVEGTGDAVLELKSIAVEESFQRQGIGAKLIRAAVRYCHSRGASRLIVSTPIAASDAIAFYLGNGFRICGHKRDVFTAEAGYPETEGSTGLPLNDAVLLDLVIPSAHSPSIRRKSLRD
jgi:GNAT superfamily N-acetyltransferase